MEEYRGHTLGVDGYSWLHKGAISCAWDLAYHVPTTRYSAHLFDFFDFFILTLHYCYRYIEYCLRRIKMLRHYGVVTLHGI